jgi:hypothetical protein
MLVFLKALLVIASELDGAKLVQLVACIDTERKVIDVVVFLQLVQEIEVLPRRIAGIGSKTHEPTVVRLIARA